VTHNGVAQGYVADRVAAILSERGIENALIDMGEIRALGSRPDRRPCSVGLESPDCGCGGKSSAGTRAVATSAGDGFIVERTGRSNHLLGPRTGGRAHRFRAVAAATATAADAISTAFSFRPPDQISSIAAGLPGVTAYVLDTSDAAQEPG
jgi:thiamine biosynthesis lipoprotein